MMGYRETSAKRWGWSGFKGKMGGRPPTTGRFHRTFPHVTWLINKILPLLSKLISKAKPGVSVPPTPETRRCPNLLLPARSSPSIYVINKQPNLVSAAIVNRQAKHSRRARVMRAKRAGKPHVSCWRCTTSTIKIATQQHYLIWNISPLTKKQKKKMNSTLCAAQEE